MHKVHDGELRIVYMEETSRSREPYMAIDIEQPDKGK